jgi:hypothetical protein
MWHVDRVAASLYLYLAAVRSLGVHAFQVGVNNCKSGDFIHKMSKRRFNEGKACDAVIRWIEAREQSSRQYLRFPEQEGHKAPIELTCVIGNRLFAFEHTGIEPFEGHIRLESKAHFRPLRQIFSKIVPSDEQYELRVPLHAMSNLTKTERERAISAISDWVSKEAPILPLAPIGRLAKPALRRASARVPFNLILHRNRLPGPGHLSVVHLVDKLDESRTQRIKRACENKFAKLAAWKAEGARTVLLFEENDDQLTNVLAVCDSLLSVEKIILKKPDEVYLVTSSNDPWWVWRIRQDSRWFSDLTPAERAYDIESKLLLPLTGR